MQILFVNEIVYHVSYLYACKTFKMLEQRDAHRTQPSIIIYDNSSFSKANEKEKRVLHPESHWTHRVCHKFMIERKIDVEAFFLSMWKMIVH